MVALVENSKIAGMTVRTVRWSDNSLPTGVVNLGRKGPNFPLLATVMQSKGQTNKPPYRDIGPIRIPGGEFIIVFKQMLVVLSIISTIPSDNKKNRLCFAHLEAS